MNTPRLIEIVEYQPTQLPQATLSEAEGRILSTQYSQQVEVQPPSLFDPYWTLTALGWVGYIPVSAELNLALKPKVELRNLFRMWEYAYRLNSFRLLEGLVQCQSLAEFYQQLANILARRVLERGRQGFYRAYVSEAEELPYARGRLEIRPSPGQVKLRCSYEEHTADIEDNQILVWTLWRILRSNPDGEQTLPMVRQAYRLLQGSVTLTPHSPQDCVNRLYHRLNEDYSPLHTLCRFFLDQSGPTHHYGDHPMLPFLVDMARLFELFVAEWLKDHRLPEGLVVKEQEKVDISRDRHYKIDLVLSDRATGQAVCVLDTKYKIGDAPIDDDIHQIVAYATAKFCREAVLIYPTPLTRPLLAQVGNIRVRSLTFSLADDLEQAGQAFLRELW